MKSKYGQYCPVSLATEILGERWTILVVLVLADGFHRFSELERALPRISASTLSIRLKSLEDAGVVERRPGDKGEKPLYYLTPAGEELGEIVFDLGRWGHRWGRDLAIDDLDPEHLIWSMHMRMNTAIMPTKRTTIAFEFADQPANKRYFWIVSENKRVQACLKHPGFDEDLHVIAKVRSLTYAWRGFVSLRDEISKGNIKVLGPSKLVKAFPDWLLGSMLADNERMRPGKERDLQRAAHDQMARASG
ncbi:MAG: helix-turn-helix domain-containing protein [Pseudomonadota bacterium]